MVKTGMNENWSRGPGRGTCTSTLDEAVRAHHFVSETPSAADKRSDEDSKSS